MRSDGDWERDSTKEAAMENLKAKAYKLRENTLDIIMAADTSAAT